MVNGPAERQISALTPAAQDACTAIKDSGVKIAVLYTTYLLDQNVLNAMNVSYKPAVAVVQPASGGLVTSAGQATPVANAMKQCASPGLYFEVGPDQGINDAMQALFVKTVQSVQSSRLTN